MFKTKNFFNRSIDKHWDSFALVGDNKKAFKYSDIGSLCKTSFFQNLDGKLVLCKINNNVECLAIYFCLLASGAIPVLVSDDIGEDEYFKLVEVYKPYAEVIKKQTAAPLTECFIDRRFDDYTIRRIAEGVVAYEINQLLSILVPTSGSTGSVKYVRLSHKNIISNTENICAYLDISQKDVVITTLPPTYSYGMSVLNTHFIRGCLIIASEKTFFEDGFWMSMEKYGVTTINCVPVQLEFLRRLKFENRKLPNLRVITQAGGHLATDLKAYFIDHCVNHDLLFFVMYGQTEASPRISYAAIPDLVESPETIGKGLDDCELFLHDHDGNQIGSNGIVGELIVKGPNIALGYAESYLDLRHGDNFKGCLRTGDLARYDEKGLFYIVGRKSRFVKIVGKRINMNDVQDLVLSSGFENVCTGNDFRLNIGCLKINPNEMKSLKKALMVKLGLPSAAIKVFELDEILRTTSGKIAFKANDDKMSEL